MSLPNSITLFATAGYPGSILLENFYLQRIIKLLIEQIISTVIPFGTLFKYAFQDEI
jgi:hypothetical protein